MFTVKKVLCAPVTKNKYLRVIFGCPAEEHVCFNSFCGISFVSLCGNAALLLGLCGVGLRDALGASASGERASPHGMAPVQRPR
jgi:hypothetical protein